ncbi:PH domain-containing protein [Ectobacillus polymachus]|uniref:PH domain-containing protein n=1 Tax=Ectobacillus polymachus TaxID=1508806 RepID=UPI003A863644
MMNRREHPITILFHYFKFLKDFIWSLIPLLFVGFKHLSVQYTILIIIGVLILIGIRNTVIWYFSIYRIEDDGLYVKKGVFTKKETFVHRDRVQSVSTDATLLHQLFHIEQVIVETAGGKAPEINLYGVPIESVHEMVAILKGKEKSLDKPKEPKTAAETYQLTKKEMLLAGATSGQFGILFTALMGLWSQVKDLLPASSTTFVTDQLIHSSYYIWIMLALVFLVFSWIAATVSFVLKYYGFRINSSSDKLHIVYGLLHKRNVTLPHKKIQGITIEEGILRGWFGFASIEAEAVVSMTDTKEYKVILHPFILKKNIPDFLRRVVPQYTYRQVEEHVPTRSLKRFLYIKVTLSFLLASGLTIWKPFLAPAFLLVLVAVWHGYACYRRAGFSIHGKQITLSYRKIAAYTTILLRKHIQSIGTEQTIFQKKDKVGTIKIYVLSGLAGKKCVKVKHIDNWQNTRILEWFEYRRRLQLEDSLKKSSAE